jgi:hypothetical protein
MKKENRKRLILQVTITSVAILAVIIHFIWPGLTLDAITITLLVIALVPWLQPLFKSLELPGGFKVEFQEVKRAKEKAERAGLLNPEPSGGGGITPYYSLEQENMDPVLLFSSLMLNIESRLRIIADNYHVNTTHASISIWDLLISLKMANALTSQEEDALKDLIKILNSGIHGAEIDNDSIKLVKELGPRIIRVLDEKATPQRG